MLINMFEHCGLRLEKRAKLNSKNSKEWCDKTNDLRSHIHYVFFTSVKKLDFCVDLIHKICV